MIGNIAGAREFTRRLQQMRCQVALDDFGSGYASLTYLKYLPFDIVKIDGELVKNMRENRSDQIIVGSVAKMCQELGIRTVAEFVEDTETLSLVRDLGIDFAQGYAVGRPRPSATLVDADSPPGHTSETKTA